MYGKAVVLNLYLAGDPLIWQKSKAANPSVETD
jgi:hypothetical protein